MEIDKILTHFKDVKKVSLNQWQGRCPAHDDKTPSLSISEGEDGKTLLHCHAGCHKSAVLKAAGLKASDLFPYTERSRIVATYAYTDKTGEVLFEVCRKEPKGFVQRRPDDNGKWIYNLKGVRRVLYHLPELLNADRDAVVWIVEGEKDVERLASLGFVATCSPGGADKWRQDYNEFFSGRDVVIIPDNDEAGRNHAKSVGEALQRIAASVTIVELPDVPPDGGDVSDWLSQGHTKEELLALVEDTPDWIPTNSTATSTAFRDFHLTDVGNAQRLVALCGRDLHYCYGRNRWFVWDGKHWAIDESGAVTRKAKATIRELYTDAGSLTDSGERKAVAQWAMRSESDRLLRSMVSLARSEPSIPIRLKEFNKDPWKLNVLNGIVDLQSGTLEPHKRDGLISKLASVEYQEDKSCPLWKSFLERVLDGDEDLISFVQRAVGYALTGSVREQVFFLLYGTGANGKSTFLETLRALLGDYAQHADFSTFLVRVNDGPRNDLARLDGARLVTAQEIENGRRFSESTLKQLTGEDTVTARFLYTENFEFKPMFKLFLAANHKPIIRGTDLAIWRRVCLIPFTVTIPEQEQDKELSAKLRGELPGILNWVLDGCRQWQAIGLKPPEAVTDATAMYQSEMDILGQFLAARCIRSKMFQATAKELYQAYLIWCEETGDKAISKRAFGLALAERGLDKSKSHGRILWKGIGLVTGDDGDDGDDFSESPLTRENMEKFAGNRLDPPQGPPGQTGSELIFSKPGDDGDDINPQDTLESRGT